MTGAGEPGLRVRSGHGPVTGVVLVLGGGRADSLARGSRRHLSYQRMRPFARTAARAAGPRGIAVWRLRYRVRGWNGDARDPVRDAFWALALAATRHPGAPVVLVGHSMGGMTIMALAEAHPEVFGSRVTGVVFISTSAGHLSEPAGGWSALLGRFSRQLIPVISTTGRTGAGVIDAARRASTDLAWLLTRRYGFGTPRPTPALVSYVERMNGRTGTDVVARYVRALSSHARGPALEALRDIRVLAVCGDKDALTPLAQSEEICRVLPKTRLVVVPDTGHVALMERPDVVNGAILAFLDELAA